MKKLIVYLSFIIIYLPVFSQNSKVDSLENILANHQKNDTTRINLLNEIAIENMSVNKNKSLQYARLADSLSDIINYKKGKATSSVTIGEYYKYSIEYARALEYFQKSIIINKEIGDKTGISYSYNYIGNIYLMQGNYAQAQIYYQKALNVFKEIDDKIGISGIYNNLGNIYYMRGDYPKTLEYFQKALKVFEELKNKIGISGTYNNIGVVYDEQNNYPKALEYYQKALQMRKELADKYGISDSYTNIGSTYMSMDDYPQALKYFQKSLIINKDLDDKSGISISYLNMGIIYQAQGDYSKSLDYYQKSIKLAEETGSQNMITINNIEFCKVYFKLKNYMLAIQYGEKGYNLAVELGEKENIRDASGILAKCYAATSNYKKAYQYHIELKTQSDSLFNESNIEKITNLENQYKYEKEKEIIAAEQAKKDAIQTEKFKRQKIIRNSFIAGFALMIVLALIIFRNLAQKRKANQKLALQKKEIEEQTEELKTANDKLVELDTFKRGMTSMIVHDLKNPLNGIINVSNSYSAENQVQQMKKIGKQMLNMVLNILDVHKYEETKMTVDQTPLSLSKLAYDAIDGVQFLADKKNISIENNILSNMAVKADKEIMGRVFENLLTNAIKYTPNNGNISLSAEDSKEKIGITKISVKDTGEGIPTEKFHLVFAKFGQTAAKKSGSVRSTGLGLTFCKLAVEAHGGEIGVYSELNKGTTFWFTLQSAAKVEINEKITDSTNDLQNKYTLSHSEKLALTSTVNKLKECEIYEMSKILKILKEVDDNESNNIKLWKEEILNTVGTGNEKRYKQLLISSQISKL